MPKADFFSRLGLFAVKNFFDPDSCAKFYSEARFATNSAATIYDRDGNFILDEEVRKTKLIRVSKNNTASVYSQLIALKPKLEEHFKVTLNDCEQPQFLKYVKGDFYLPHTDRKTGTESPKYIRVRQISVAVFLNSETEQSQPNCYSGGALTFYGLIDDSRWQNYGFSLNGEAGLLIAFPSHIWHEVQPVIQGERYTIVTWFF